MGERLCSHFFLLCCLLLSARRSADHHRDVVSAPAIEGSIYEFLACQLDSGRRPSERNPMLTTTRGTGPQTLDSSTDRAMCLLTNR